MAPDHIQNLRRLGLTPEGPGSGRAISYDYEYGLKWLIGIEFGSLHVDPSTTAAFIHEHWDPIRMRIQEARDAGPGGWDDVLLTIKFNSVMAKTPDVRTTTVRGGTVLAIRCVPNASASASLIFPYWSELSTKRWRTRPRPGPRIRQG